MLINFLNCDIFFIFSISVSNDTFILLQLDVCFAIQTSIQNVLFAICSVQCVAKISFKVGF